MKETIREKMSTKAFYILYFDLNMGRDVFPIECCIKNLGVSIKSLPPEINVIIWYYYHDPSSTTLRHHALLLLETFHTKEPLLFRYIIHHMLKTINPDSGRQTMSVDTFSVYAESIWNILHKRSLRGTHMTVGLVTFLKQHRVIVWMLQQQINLALNLIEEYTDDTIIMNIVLQSHPSMLSRASFRLQDDEEFILRTSTKCLYPTSLLRNMSERLKNKKEVVMKILKQSEESNSVIANNIEDIVERLRDDEDVMTEAITKFGTALQFASERLRCDKKLALLAVKNNGIALQHVHESIRYDRDVVLCALKNSGNAMEFVGQEHQDDRTIVEFDIENGGWGFEFVHPRFRNDEEIVKKLVMCDGTNLMFVTDRLRDDLYIVVTAMQADIYNFPYSSERLRDSHAVALNAVRCDFDGNCFESVSDRLKNDHKIVMAAVSKYGENLKNASRRLRADKDIVMTAVRGRGDSILKYASYELKDDDEVVMAAVTRSPENILYASERLKNSKQVLLNTFRAKYFYHHRDPILKFVDRHWRSDYDIVKAAVTQHGINLEFADERLKDDEDIVSIAVAQPYSAIQFASKRLKNNKQMIMRIRAIYTLVHLEEQWRDDKEVVMSAVARGDSIQLASLRLQADEDIIWTHRFQ